jgi:predicted HNH restriction endonuclease
MVSKPIDEAKLDRIVAQARRDAVERDRGYREQALKLYPWVCGRCGREFTARQPARAHGAPSQPRP